MPIEYFIAMNLTNFIMPNFDQCNTNPPQVLLGQVMHRQKLTWLGGKANHADRSSMVTFGILAIIAAVNFCVSMILYWTLFVLLIRIAAARS